MNTLSPLSLGRHPFPLLTVQILVFNLQENRLQVLLTHQQDALSDSLWVLPGRPVELNEALEMTASRELTRLLGVHEVYLEQLYTFGDPGRDPNRWTVSVVYYALVPASALLSMRKDDESLQWFPVDHLPPLAFDHGKIINYALRRLKYKLEYTAVGFQLLPAEFTLSELQYTYEMILGEKLDKRNFRRRILEAGIIEPTGNLGDFQAAFLEALHGPDRHPVVGREERRRPLDQIGREEE